ncbi:hypothetical protein IP87_12440 [beta proteobacterium AAP121]|nr:hypothetical protein IP80_09705 [beta proteobacterium AAP65]KPF97181.1 hypothetical protein IP87_12440 [beta proteobacterium AAP121]
MLGLCTFEIFGPPDVQPWLVHGVNDGARRALLQAAEQFWHVAWLTWHQSIQCLRLQHIDACIDVGSRDGLFLKTDDVYATSAHHAEGMLPLV